jgi:Fe-S-cluster containining protein
MRTVCNAGGSFSKSKQPCERRSNRQRHEWRTARVRRAYRLLAKPAFDGGTLADSLISSMPTLKSCLPPLYHGRLPDVIDETYPDERFATCDSCTKCQSPSSPFIDTKCCSYYPCLPNYSVGGVLTDTASLGRERVLATIQSRIGVTPFGLVRPISRSLQPWSTKLLTRAEAESLLCPYYDDGTCGIWSHREHLCSTYFCHSIGGAAGNAFWKAFDDYLTLVERTLAKHALQMLGWPIELLSQADPLSDWQPEATIEGERRQTESWREWAGRERELYVACHAAVLATDRKTLERLLGVEGRQFEVRLRALLGQFREAAFPERLRLAPTAQITSTGGDDVLVSVDGAPPVRVTRVAAAFLKEFDGLRATTAVVRLAASVMVDLTRYIGPLRTAQVLLDA